MDTPDAIAAKLDAEQLAVFAVIQAETRAFFTKDFDGFARCWVHEPYIRRLGWWTRGGVSDRWGWDDLGARTRRAMLDFPDYNRSADEVTYDNFVLRVAGDMAYSTFDQYAPDTGDPDFDMPGCSREVRVLERRDGEWLIVYHTYVHQTIEPARSPMFRVDKDANLSWMNTSAEAAIKGGQCGLALSSGRLRAVSEADNRKLRAAIAGASARDGTLDGGRAAVPLILDLGEESDVCVCWVLTEGSGYGAVLVSINNLTFAQDQLDAATTVFGLSPAQQRLVEQIASGRDLVTAASHLGVSINTARTHLQRIFEKTGVRSQAALLRTLLSLDRPA
jgi:DNA-binding CsgD family transcriptional regulator